MNNGNKKTPYKKNVIWIVLIAGILLVLTILLVIITPLPACGTSKDGWLSFLGSFFGGVIGGMAAIITLIYTLRDNKKQMRQQAQHDQEAIERQKEQFKIEIQSRNEIERIHEMPYLVFIKAEVEEDTYPRVKLSFRNKGRGSAYNIIPPVSINVKIPSEEDKKLSRCIVSENPIAMVGELYTTFWSLGKEKKSFLADLPITYEDASGRKYRQTFHLIIDDTFDHGDCTNFATPELVNEQGT